MRFKIVDTLVKSNIWDFLYLTIYYFRRFLTGSYRLALESLAPENVLVRMQSDCRKIAFLIK